MTHCVLCDTLGQQSGVDPDGGSGDIEDPRDLLHRQAAHLLLCLVPHHLVIPGPAHHHSQQGPVTLGKCAAVIDTAKDGVRLTARHQEPESLMIKDPASELYVDHTHVDKGDLAQMMRQLRLQIPDKKVT